MPPLYAYRLTAHVDRGMSSPAMWDGCPVVSLSGVRGIRAGDETKRLEKNRIHRQRRQHDGYSPLFVTWNVRPSRPGRSHRLRGCIGSFEPHALHEGIAEYARISAFKDYRFNKITRGELDSLECVVSLLTDFEDGSSYLDWTIGVHGIYITFPHPSLLAASQSESSTPSPYSSSTTLLSSSSSSASSKHAASANYRKTFNATYLPEVAPAQGWDKIETVDSAIHKAGWSGRITEEIRRSVKLRRYQSRVCTVTWHQFAEWRKANGGRV